MSINGAPVMAATVVAVDVGKKRAALSATDADRRRLLGPVDFAMTAPAQVAVLERVWAVLPAGPVKVRLEAAGHYHRPLLELRLCVLRARRVQGSATSGAGLIAHRRLVGIKNLLVLTFWPPARSGRTLRQRHRSTVQSRARRSGRPPATGAPGSPRF